MPRQEISNSHRLLQVSTFGKTKRRLETVEISTVFGICGLWFARCDFNAFVDAFVNHTPGNLTDDHIDDTVHIHLLMSFSGCLFTLFRGVIFKHITLVVVVFAIHRISWGRAIF